jgi:hypothetical protein
MEKDILKYLYRLVDSYLDNKILLYNDGGVPCEANITAGVPQGSVIGPTLWNVVYYDYPCRAE